MCYNHERDEWFKRHTERYPKWYMSGGGLFSLNNIPFSIHDYMQTKYGYPKDFTMSLLLLSSFLKKSEIEKVLTVELGLLIFRSLCSLPGHNSVYIYVSNQADV